MVCIPELPFGPVAAKVAGEPLVDRPSHCGESPHLDNLKNGHQILVTFRSYQSDDRAWVIESNSWFYQTFHDFDATFINAVRAALDSLEGQMSNATSNYFIVEAMNRPVGCVFFSAETPVVGRIRLFYLEQAYRRQGIGMRLLRDILTDARKNGFEAVRVSTFDRHPEACRLYEAFGFGVLKSCRSEAFGQVMQQIDYELLFGGGER